MNALYSNNTAKIFLLIWSAALIISGIIFGGKGFALTMMVMSVFGSVGILFRAISLLFKNQRGMK